jgi:hypothetical protein
VVVGAAHLLVASGVLFGYDPTAHVPSRAKDLSGPKSEAAPRATPPPHREPAKLARAPQAKLASAEPVATAPPQPAPEPGLEPYTPVERPWWRRMFGA